MLKTLLLKFWPALIPIALYLIWLIIRSKRKDKKGDKQSQEEKNWTWVAIVSLFLIIACFLYILFEVSQDAGRGDYTPATFQDGQFTPGKVE